MQFFILDFWNDYVWFFVCIYEKKQLKLQVERCFALLFNQCIYFDNLQGAAIFIEQVLAIVQQFNVHTHFVEHATDV